ncbi:FUSC family protein [Streptomyces sp. HNM0574]|uniref:FUSC family protein n=1 Tax=Streptomyces sp. HNM0574 TaxID=2714954 RepID=UPI00146EC1D1|nr:FUSC family protein [Streptomyces sp. HNM0574]NLU70364.1 FUSC family protein [Streptomyces sp. HNM0574]
MIRVRGVVRPLVRSFRRWAVTTLLPVLSPRGALRLARVEGAAQFALHAALGMALAMLPPVLAGRPDLAVYPALGAFTATFERGLPHRRRLTVLAVVAAAMTVAVGAGSALASVTGPDAGRPGDLTVIAATALVAGAAKYLCDVTRLRGLGAVLVLLGFAVAADHAPRPGEELLPTALAAFGAGMAWLLAWAGSLWRPDRLQRLAVSEALGSVAALLEAAGPDAALLARRRATTAVLRAHRSLGIEPAASPQGREQGRTLVRLTGMTWTLLVTSVREPVPGVAPSLRRQARLLADRRRRLPPVVDGLPLDVVPSPAGTSPHVPGADGEPLRARSARHRLASLVAPALRTTVGTGLAGGLALVLGLGHGYWAAITAAAVLHSINVYSTVHRAVQRTLGTALGLVLAWAVLATRPEPLVIVLVVLVLEFLLEYVVARNYGLGVVFLTPLALLLSELQTSASPGTLLHDRVTGSALGVLVGLGCALLVVHDRAAARVRHELAVCRGVVERAAEALDGPPERRRTHQGRLAAALVDLREADDAAAGELWSAGIDPAELAAVERRAYDLLHRLAGP